MVSNATAVPQSNSKPIMKNISNRKQQISLLEERLEENIEKLNDIISNVQPKGLIDIILAIITAIIDLLTDIIYKLIDFIDQIQYLLSSLINAIQALIDKITEFIEWLQDLFNPESNTVIQ
jgi:phage-related protein